MTYAEFRKLQVGDTVLRNGPWRIVDIDHSLNRLQMVYEGANSFVRIKKMWISFTKVKLITTEKDSDDWYEDELSDEEIAMRKAEDIDVHSTYRDEKY